MLGRDSSPRPSWPCSVTYLAMSRAGFLATTLRALQCYLPCHVAGGVPRHDPEGPAERAQCVVRCSTSSVHQLSIRAFLPHCGVQLANTLYNGRAGREVSEVVPDDDLKVLITGQIAHVEFSKSIPQPWWQFSLANICGWVHAGKQAELWVPWEGTVIASLQQCQRASVRLEQTGQTLQSFRVGQIYFIE